MIRALKRTLVLGDRYHRWAIRLSAITGMSEAAAEREIELLVEGSLRRTMENGS